MIANSKIGYTCVVVSCDVVVSSNDSIWDSGMILEVVVSE